MLIDNHFQILPGMKPENLNLIETDMGTRFYSQVWVITSGSTKSNLDWIEL